MQQLGLSPNAPKTPSRLRELLWPDVSDTVAAETAARNGMYASFFIAAVTTLFSLLGLAAPSAVLDAVLFVIIGIGIRKMSRIAAVAGLVLYLAEQGYAISRGRTGFNLVMLVIITAIFISSVRAAWSFRRFREPATQSKVI